MPMIGTREISIHHADLSLSCQRLPLTQMPGQMSAMPKMNAMAFPSAPPITELCRKLGDGMKKAA